MFGDSRRQTQQIMTMSNRNAFGFVPQSNFCFKKKYSYGNFAGAMDGNISRPHTAASYVVDGKKQHMTGQNAGKGMLK
jgi:hypothetical protein